MGMRILSISKGGSKISVDLSEVAYASHHSIQLAFPAGAFLHATAYCLTTAVALALFALQASLQDVHQLISDWQGYTKVGA